MGSKLIFILAIVLLQEDLLCYATKDVRLAYIYRNKAKMVPTVLDCDYEIEADTSMIALKWFKDDRPIYHWVRGSSPAVNPYFRNQINTSYVASSDPNKRYSSLALINPTIITTGDYKCVVLTEANVNVFEQTVQVIDLSKYSLDLYHNTIPNGTQVQCILTGMYPRPSLKIISQTGEVIKEESNAQENEDGYFNATASVDVNESRAKSYGCQVFFENGIQLN
ncbi:uncharacterized protein LOC108144158 [Drosophila elegans]|uniref:uncharacterized protein LOC108144158 n=1 Tax=Drosophila elegans TaxID=30023 RepID=UPI001BC83058|nr:uncharacterized protein LOC108144158 [Drosophila elegans]